MGQVNPEVGQLFREGKAADDARKQRQKRAKLDEKPWWRFGF
jgi:hypothetical protein